MTWKPLPANTSAVRPGKGVRGEPAVITNDDSPPGARHRVRGPVIGRGLRHPRDIGKGELIGDDCPPTVRTERDAHNA